MGDEGYIVAIIEADLAFKGAISLKFGPAMAGDVFALVVPSQSNSTSAP